MTKRLGQSVGEVRAQRSKMGRTGGRHCDELAPTRLMTTSDKSSSVSLLPYGQPRA